MNLLVLGICRHFVRWEVFPFMYDNFYTCMPKSRIRWAWEKIWLLNFKMKVIVLKFPT